MEKENISVTCGHIRVHSTRIPGSPGFAALIVEVRDRGSDSWDPVDLFALDTWCDSAEARAEMEDLIQEYKSCGYILVSELPALWAA